MNELNPADDQATGLHNGDYPEILSERFDYEDGSVTFDFDVEPLRDNEYLIHVRHLGRTIHATYNNPRAAKDWLYDRFDYPMTSGDAIALAGWHADQLEHGRNA